MDHRPGILKVLGNETRLRVLLALADRRAYVVAWGAGAVSPEQTVYSICQLTGLDRPVVKRALAQLYEVRLVERVPNGDPGDVRFRWKWRLPDGRRTEVLMMFFHDLELLTRAVAR